VNAEIPRSRPGALGIVAIVWLSLVSALAILDHVRLARSPDAQGPTAQSSEVVELESRVAALEATMSKIQRQPAPVTAARYEATERAQDVRLAQIETSLTNVVHEADIVPLRVQLTHLAAEVWRLRHPLPARPKPVIHVRAPNAGAVRRPVEVPPPFVVLGTELRGGEEFLTVAPRDAQSLFQVRVLRPGESDGSWTLEAIEGRTAVFVTADRVERVPIP
jgi:hypothetical protein